MHYKTETKEKFTVVTLLDTSLTSNLVPQINDLSKKLLAESPKNIIVNCQQVTQWDEASIQALFMAQQTSYDNNASFVLCELSNSLQSQLDLTEYAEIMNCTPTEPEAGDIVLMEEIERELLDSDDFEFSQNN